MKLLEAKKKAELTWNYIGTVFSFWLWYSYNCQESIKGLGFRPQVLFSWLGGAFILSVART